MAETLWQVIRAWSHADNTVLEGSGRICAVECHRCQIECWARSVLKNVGNVNVLRQVIGDVPNEGEEKRDDR